MRYIHRYKTGLGQKHVGGLPFSADKDQLRADFGKYGEIKDVFLPENKDTGQLRGFGFITFKDARDAKDAAKSMHM